MSGGQERDEALTWIRVTIRERGLFGALRYYAAGSLELLRDLTPQRRRSRYGDIDYDFDHGVDTTWATISLRTRIRELLAGGQYQPTEPGLFHEILRAVPVDLDGYTFIDLGSGKGRTLLMASDFPFSRIIGREILAELDAIAKQNTTRYQGEHQKCFDIESYCGDARDFQFPLVPTVLYLFNPFPEYVLAEVLENLHESLLAAPRTVYVVYHNLIHERTFARCTWLQCVYRTTQFAIYQTQV